MQVCVENDAGVCVCVRWCPAENFFPPRTPEVGAEGRKSMQVRNLTVRHKST